MFNSQLSGRSDLSQSKSNHALFVVKDLNSLKYRERSRVQRLPKLIQVERIEIAILGTRMNTDYKDNKSYKYQISVETCENLCPSLN